MKSMKVLLIHPLFEDSFWSARRALKFAGKLCAFPPLGLLTVSAMLPQEWEQRLVDENVHKLSDADIAWADLIFVTGMLVQKERVHQIIGKCKAMGKKVALGGPYISTSVEQEPEADHIFVGEAELTLPQFLKDLELGIPERKYEVAENKPDLGLTPIPNFQLINPRDYGAMMVQYSRGCPFSCEFCDIIEIYGRVPRTKSNEQLLAEFDLLYNMGWRGTVFIVDDNFIGNKKNVRQLLPDLIRWQERHDFPFSLLTEASVNLAEDQALLADMQKASFQKVFLGIETPVEACLVAANKKQNTHSPLLDSVKRIQSYGMEVMAGFIVGFDNDPEEIFDLMVQFIKDSAIPRAMVGVLQALPDTQLWRRLEKEGRLLKESCGTVGNSLNFIPKMDAAKLIAGYEWVQKTIFHPRAYYDRVLDNFSRLPKENKERSPLSFSDKIAAATRIILIIGVVDRHRFEFWRFITTTLLKHPSRLGQAFAFAANGYHFRTLLPE